jgi:gluconate 2-dehydrogenase gamma chain
MDRREAIKRTALLMGGVVSAPAIMGILKGCAPKSGIDWKPVFLDKDQAYIVSQVAEIIIPKTDTPGAKDVGVPGFIDLLLKDVYSSEDQKWFLDGLQVFNTRSQEKYGETFSELDEDDQVEYLTQIHGEALKAERNTSPAPKRPFIMMMKELTMLGFFTSKVGASEILQYDPVPGAYKGCIPVSEAGNGKTWAS